MQNDSFESLQNHQGYLLKKQKMGGFRNYFVVLNRGNITYYTNSSHASEEIKQKKTLSLEGAILKDAPNKKSLQTYTSHSFVLYLKSGKKFIFFVVPIETKAVMKLFTPNLTKEKRHRWCNEKKQKKKEWLKALEEHIQFAHRLIEFQELGEKLHFQIERIEHNLIVSDSRFLKPETSSVLKTHPPTNGTRRTREYYSEYQKKLPPLVEVNSEGNDSHFDSSFDDDSYDTAEEMETDNSEESSSSTKEEKEFIKDVTIFYVKKDMLFNPDGFYIDINSWRKTLPAPQFDQSKLNFLDVAKNFIGKDLFKMRIPPVFCEPITIIQRFAESLQYVGLLSRAAKCQDPCRRMELVSACLFSAVCALERIGVPFFSVLGETYEVIREDLGFRFVTELVTNQPTGAWYAESLDPDAKWAISGQVTLKFSFWGRCLGIDARALNILHLDKYNESYIARGVPISVHSLIFGPRWIEHHENFQITCPENGYKTVLNFKPATSNKQDHRYDGYIFDKNMKKEKALFGEWLNSFYSCEPNSYERYLKINPHSTASELANSNSNLKDLTRLWVAFEQPPNQENYYWFSYFALSLNQLTPELESLIAPTDSRFRKDLRCLEIGDTEGAAIEGHKIKDGQSSGPLWFKLERNHLVNDELWTFTHKYWERDYRHCPKLF